MQGRKGRARIATTLLVPLLFTACAGGAAADPAGSNLADPVAPNPAATVNPPDSPSPACDDWNRWNFFASASAELVRECLEAGADPRAPVRSASQLVGLRADGRSGYTPLHAAAARNPNPAIIDALVAAGANLEARGLDGATPLHAAWTNPNPAVFRALLRLGADPLARDERGRAADPTSCANWNTAAFSRFALPRDFELCLRLDQDLQARDTDGNTPLHLAVAVENPTAATILLDAGADLGARNNAGATPLHIGAIKEDAEILTRLLDAGADVNAGADGSGTPLLHAVVSSGGYQRRGTGQAAVNALLEAGADVNAADSAGNTPLLASMGPGRREGPLADLPLRLLALGADPNRRDAQGRTPLYAAAGVEGPEVVRALLEAGADPSALTNDGASPLHAAAGSGNPEVIALLAGAGVDPNGLTDGSRAPLHLAAGEPLRGLFGMIQDAHWRLRASALLEADADPDVRTAEGDTPLHVHAWARRPDTALVSVLVLAGADVNARNDAGETPLHVARKRNRLSVVRTLLELGADANAIDNAGRIADPVCHWGPGDINPWQFLARSPAESVQGCLENGIPVDERDEQGATFLARMVSAVDCCADFDNVLSVFVAAGADANARDNAGRTPLHRALTGRIPAWLLPDVVSALLDVGADPNARDSQGSTPMQLAVSRGGSGPLVSLLAGAGADPALPEGAGNTPDPVACGNWGTQSFFALASADIVAGCIDGGADVDSVVGRGTRAASPLSIAAASTRDADLIRVLLQAGADIAARDGFYEYTPLHHAALSGTAEVVRVLVEADAELDAWATGFGVDWGWGWTPLHLAARSNPDPDVVRALAEAGADLGARGDESYRKGNTPLHYAGENPNPAVAAALLDAGADVNTLSETGTPLHEAAANASNRTVIELLIAAGADVNAYGSNGYTPLHSAAWYNPHPEVMTALIAAGGDVNARDPDGYVPSGRAANDRSPLLMALYRGGFYVSGQPWATGHNVPVVEVLVRAGADLQQTDGSGLTPLHAAAIWQPAAFPLLLRLGAAPNARDADGNTPMDYALENRSLEGLPEVRRLREAMRGR